MKKASENKKTKLLYCPPVHRKRTSQTDILRIEISQEYTRVDFCHLAMGTLTNGGWMSISPETYLQPCESGKKLKLLEAVNIPIAPMTYRYKQPKETHYYTLYFEPLPKGTKRFNIIESEKAINTVLNFYGVSLSKRKLTYRYSLN